MIEQEIPIDIHTNKLIDWLVTRRICSKDWQNNILTIRQKINNAIQNMPKHDGIANLLSGTYINYFHCLKIIEILKETEADTKNIFGRYGSQKMRDWQEIVKLYEKDNLYLAECSQILIRNCSYEIPGIKKQFAKLEQMQLECTKKEKEFQKNEKFVLNEYNVLCKQLGISTISEGSFETNNSYNNMNNSIRRELIELLSGLNKIYSEISEDMKSLRPALNLYDDYNKTNINKSSSFNLLNYIIEHGNTTTYEYTYDEAPLQIEEPPLSISNEVINKKSNTQIEIDFGDANDNNEIDFGDDDDTNKNSDNDGEIDWGNMIEAIDDVSSNNNTVNGNETIDFDCVTGEESGIVVEASGNEGGVARGNEAFTLLDNPLIRGRVIDELMELESFLTMRLYELSNTNDNFTNFDDNQTVLMQTQTQDSVAQFLRQVQAILAQMMSKRIEHLHNIKHSPRYLDYLIIRLKQKLNVAAKMRDAQKGCQLKREEYAQQARDLLPVLKLCIERTKEIQKQIEEDISKKYKNRLVNLMGGVNVLY